MNGDLLCSIPRPSVGLLMNMKRHHVQISFKLCQQATMSSYSGNMSMSHRRPVFTFVFNLKWLERWSVYIQYMYIHIYMYIHTPSKTQRRIILVHVGRFTIPCCLVSHMFYAQYVCTHFIPDSATEYICKAEIIKDRCPTHTYSFYVWESDSTCSRYLTYGVERLVLISAEFVFEAEPRLHLCSPWNVNTLAK